MQTLALKYRPRKFDELIGQETISKSLCNALNSGRLGHAYLFSGLRGSGKTSTARIFAKSLVCSHGPTALPCETCENCTMANTSRHIDDIRELIEQSRYAPSVARFKVFIIDEVHMLTKEAFNALLKTLEEPPSYVKFILATTDPLKLPATVLSRTQHFHFKPIARGLITKHLAKILQNENVAYEDAALEILARSGSGSLRDTITLLDQAIIYSKENVTASAVSAMLGLLDPQKISEILSIAINQDKSAAINLASELENYEQIYTGSAKVVNFAKKYHVLRYEIRKFESRISRIYEALQICAAEQNELKKELKNSIHKCGVLKSMISEYSLRVEDIYTFIQSDKNDKINKNIYLLTLLSALFLPINFITGFFGMNTNGMFLSSFKDGTLIVFAFVAMLCVLFFIFYYRTNKDIS